MGMKWIGSKGNVDQVDGQHGDGGGRTLARTDLANDFGVNTQSMDTIAESSSAVGVTIDGVLMKDKSVQVGDAVSAGTVDIYASDNKKVIVDSPSGMAGNWTMTLPTTGGTNTYVLQTDGSGNTSWVAQSVAAVNRTVKLAPEFPNAIWQNDATNNTITIDTLNTGSTTWENFYVAESAEASLQDADLYMYFRLPDDWSDWQTNAIQLVFLTETIDPLDQKLDLEVYDPGTAGAIKSLPGEVSSVADTKRTLSITATDLGANFAAGDPLLVHMKVYSKSGNHVKLFTLHFNYVD